MERIVANASEPKLHLGILLGLLLTDGSISGNCIEFTNKSQELVELFKEKFRKIFGISNIWEGKDKRDREIKRVRIKNKKIAELLSKLLKEGDKKKIPKMFFHLNKQQIKKIFQVMFSTDGCVSVWVVWNKKRKLWEIKKYVKISNYSREIRENLIKLLSSIGFSPINRESNKEVVLFKKRDIIKFSKEIGFVKGVKITQNSKYWRGFEKNDVLNLAIKSFELRKDKLKNFKTKIEVINFLKKLMGNSVPMLPSELHAAKGAGVH